MNSAHLRRIRISGLGLALCMASIALAGAQSLSEALADAYATNPTLDAARAELRAVNEGAPQALANWRPEGPWLYFPAPSGCHSPPPPPRWSKLT